MRGLLFSFFLLLPLYGSQVNNELIDIKEDSVDIMLTFDTPYRGKIIQKKEQDETLLILEKCSIEKKKTREINSSLVQTLQLIPYEKDLLIKLASTEAFTLDASKSVDLYGLRLRIKKRAYLSELETLPLEENITHIETKKEDNIWGAYVKMILVLLSLVALLYLLKRWLEKNTGHTTSSWLFQQDNKKKQADIKVIKQQPLDTKNRLSVVRYKDKEYLMVIGSTNLLLDSFPIQDDVDSSFDDVLSKNQKELEHYIKQTKIDAYKEKIASN